MQGTETAPAGAFSVHSEKTGTCFIPEQAFGSDLRVLLASLDWARVHQSRGTADGYAQSALELDAVARHARGIAEACESFARIARDEHRS